MIEIISISIILGIVLFFQWRVFITARNNIDQLLNIFPSDYFKYDSYITWKQKFEEKNKEQYEEIIPEYYYISQSKTYDDYKIKHPVLNYLKRNNFKINDYNYVKDIVENYCDSIENKINSIISIPLYIGLISTFFCIFLTIVWGLISGLSNEAWIRFLLPSISIPMIASAFGLFLTVWNTGRNYKNAKFSNDRNKRDFYSFIQEHFIATTPQNFNSFIETFAKNFKEFTSSVHQFKDASQEIIHSFRLAFKDNIENSFVPATKEFTRDLNIFTKTFNQDVKDTVNKQLEIITKVKDANLPSMADAILNIYKTLEESSTNLKKFSNYVLNVNTYVENTNKLIENSDKLVGHTTELIDTTEKTYNRFNSFGNKVEDITSSIYHNLELAGKIEEFFNNNIDYLREQTGFVHNTHIDINNALQTYIAKVGEDIKETLREYNNSVIDIIKEFKESLEKRPEIFAKIEPLTTLNTNLVQQGLNYKELSESINRLIDELNKRKPDTFDIQKSVSDEFNFANQPGIASIKEILNGIKIQLIQNNKITEDLIAKGEKLNKKNITVKNKNSTPQLPDNKENPINKYLILRKKDNSRIKFLKKIGNWMLKE